MFCSLLPHLPLPAISQPPYLSHRFFHWMGSSVRAGETDNKGCWDIWTIVCVTVSFGSLKDSVGWEKNKHIWGRDDLSNGGVRNWAISFISPVDGKKFFLSAVPLMPEPALNASTVPGDPACGGRNRLGLFMPAGPHRKTTLLSQSYAGVCESTLNPEVWTKVIPVTSVLTPEGSRQGHQSSQSSHCWGGECQEVEGAA